MTRTFKRTMRRLAGELVRSFAQRVLVPFPGLGLTVIVHSPRPSPGAWAHALDTTLSNPAHVRALLAEALACSAMADGATPDTAGELASNDYLAALAKPREVRPS